MLSLAFLELFVLLSTLLILSRFLPAPGFYEGCVHVPGYLYLMDSCAGASLLSQLDFQPHPGDPPLYTLSLVNVSDDLWGNWAHDCVEF